jgi:glycosyltransferase involved in cell wall biosynthesis
MNPLVSIILPVYNGEKYLKETLDSILNQNYSNFELIIINDGSSDKSEEIILSFKDARIVYIKNETNIKLIASLNKGINISKGTYIARIDQDDIVYKNRFKTQIDFLENNSEYILVGTDVDIISNLTENKTSKKRYYSENDDLVFALMFYCPFIHPSVLIRKQVLDDNLLYYDEDFLHAEDYELWTRMVFVGKVANIPEAHTAYRIHLEQTSQKHIDIQNQQILKIRNKYINNLLPELTELEKKILFDGTIKNIKLKTSLETLKKFENNNSIIGQAKKRFIFKSAKRKIEEIQNIKMDDLIFTLRSKYFWMNTLTIKQKIVFLKKII